VLQFVLLLGVAVAGLAGPAWPQGVRPVARVTGLGTLVVGVVLVVSGSAALGSALTPLPWPREGASFRDDGVYRLARHPIYGGVLLIALGGALLSSALALVPVALLGLPFEGKSMREEAWLTERYPGYAAYRDRVRRRFLPFVW
jgi:protein-S-isoprenylcysteine O-methyltransferase Ste14